MKNLVLNLTRTTKLPNSYQHVVSGLTVLETRCISYSCVDLVAEVTSKSTLSRKTEAKCILLDVACIEILSRDHNE